MYLAVDIGGTKTLLAVFDKNGSVIERVKFATPKDYAEFTKELANTVATLRTKDFDLVCMAIPGLINRDTGVVHALGNLPWVDKPIRGDVSSALNDLEIIIENDTRLAGLHEALQINDTFQNVLYITISTGIGGALISEGKIVKAVQDMEVGKIPVQYDGVLQHWEEFASGRAIVAAYGKRASEIEDPVMWHEIGLKVAYGTAIASSTIQPDAIVFGGGAGQFAEKFIPTVQEYMEANLHAIAKRPKLLPAQNPEEAVIYGCYELARQHYEKHSA